MNKDNKTWDNLDFFLNRAYWSYLKYEDFFDKRLQNISQIINLLESNDINYVFKYNDLQKETNINKKNYEIIYLDSLSSYNLIDGLLQKEKFHLIYEEESYKYFEKLNIVIKFIHSKNKSLFKNITLVELMNNLSIKCKIEKNIFLNILKKINHYRFKIVNFIIKKINLIRIIGLQNTLTFDQNKQYEISKKAFLKLKFESKDSINWKLRGGHLNLVTNFGKNKKIYKIIRYFKNNKLANGSLNIIETDTSSVFKEPIHLNRKFWEGGTNFFIYPIIFGFKKNVIAYKDANSYIDKKNEFKLYSYSYYQNLESMSDVEINSFLKHNPIEINNIAISSGRHRASAMIGRLVRDQKYISFYAKFV